MVNRSINAQVKFLALELWEDGWSIPDILYIFKISRASLFRWCKIFREHSNVCKPKSPILGRPRKIGLAALTAMKEIYTQHPDTYLDELQWFLNFHHGIEVDISTIQRNLEQLGLTYKQLKKIAIERDEYLRAEWKLMLAEEFSGSGYEFVVVDETSKNEHEILRRFGRSMVGTPAEIFEVFVRGTRYSMVAAITLEGYIAADVVEGSFDTESFADFIINKVLPQMNEFPDKHSVLVLDNCRIHHNELIYQACQDARVLLLYLPPYSPDLTPIEESFSSFKAYLRRNKDELRLDENPMAALLDATVCITLEKCVGWFEHAGYIHE